MNSCPLTIHTKHVQVDARTAWRSRGMASFSVSTANVTAEMLFAHRGDVTDAQRTTSPGALASQRSTSTTIAVSGHLTRSWLTTVLQAVWHCIPAGSGTCASGVP